MLYNPMDYSHVESDRPAFDSVSFISRSTGNVHSSMLVQDDPEWANEGMKGNDTIGRSGGLLTLIANIIRSDSKNPKSRDINPSKLFSHIIQMEKKNNQVYVTDQNVLKLKRIIAAIYPRVYFSKKIYGWSKTRAAIEKYQSEYHIILKVKLVNSSSLAKTFYVSFAKLENGRVFIFVPYSNDKSELQFEMISIHLIQKLTKFSLIESDLLALNNSISNISVDAEPNHKLMNSISIQAISANNYKKVEENCAKGCLACLDACSVFLKHGFKALADIREFTFPSQPVDPAPPVASKNTMIVSKGIESNPLSNDIFSEPAQYGPADRPQNSFILDMTQTYDDFDFEIAGQNSASTKTLNSEAETRKSRKGRRKQKSEPKETA
jgi:hypothetical protein